MYMCVFIHTYVHSMYTHTHVGCIHSGGMMGWLKIVGSLQLYVSFAKEPYKRDDILQKRPIILRSLLIIATPYACVYTRIVV